MNTYKAMLVSVCLLLLTSCGSDNKTPPDSTEVLGSSGDASAETPTEEQQPPLAISVEKVATWKGDAKAAYSIIHDDYPYTDGLHKHYLELNNRGLRAGFGVIVGAVEEGNKHYYDKMRQMVSEGHEIINHSYSHLDLLKEGTDLNKEIDHSTALLKANGFNVTAFVFPFDQSNEAILQRLKGIGYLAARGGVHEVNPAKLNTDDPLAPFHAGWDSFFEDPATGQNIGSKYKDQGDVLKGYVDDAIQKGGWAVRELHGVEDSSWGSVSIAKYTAHLDYVVEKVKSNELWMDTFTNVTRYRSSRAYCGQALAEDSGTINFSLATSENCTKYSSPLSVVISTNGVDDITATQNGASIPSKRLDAGKYMLEIDPAAGPAYVSKP